MALYERAAALGNASAAFNAALMHHYGRGIPRDYAKAFPLFVRAEEYGYDSASLYECLGWCYRDGLGVGADPEKAFYWYKKSAEAGDVSAMAEVAGAYWIGRGVRVNRKEALKWHRKAADKGNQWAQNGLAWALATSPHASEWNGEEAVRYALMATKQKSGYMEVDTLAAAYARAGRFDEAVETQKRALEMLRAKKDAKAEDVADYESRVLLYQAKKPYTQSAE